MIVSESEQFRKLCSKMSLAEDKFITQCFKTAERSGTLDISNYSPSVGVCEAAAQILSRSANVIRLVAKDSLVPPKGVSALVRAVGRSRVTELHLTGNNISDRPLRDLAASLDGGAGIRVLILKWNNIGANRETFQCFCNSLANNSSIEYLDLRNNQISTECAKILARALATNSSIKKLDLRWNLLDCTGAECLLNLMETSRNLNNILLAGNPVSPEVVSSLGNCNKYKNDLKAIQSSYEAKINVLTKHIKDMESRRIEHVDKLCKGTEEHIHNAEMKMNELTCLLEEKDSLCTQLHYKLKETEISLESERNRSAALDSLVEEKERNYLELTATYQTTIENLRQELVKLENDVASSKIKVEKKYLEEKSKRERLENELDISRRTVEQLRENKEKLSKELEESNAFIESVESEKKAWQTKYCELDKSFGEELERLARSTVQRQRHLEKSILELTENQAKNMEAVSEKMEHCLGEKATLEAQLTASLATVSRLQQENCQLVNQMAQPSRRLAHVLEELTDEKVANEKLRQERHEAERRLEDSRRCLASLREEMNVAADEAAATVRDLRHQVRSVKGKALALANKLKERDRLIHDIREEERARAEGLLTAVASYVEPAPRPRAPARPS